jgi:hypothetical protein
MGKAPIGSAVKPLREEVFHRASLHSKGRRMSERIQVNAGQSQLSSTFVNFRQLSQRGWHEAFCLDITGIDEHTARESGEAARGGTLSILALFMRLYGGSAFFRESTNVHFRHLRAKA